MDSSERGALVADFGLEKMQDMSRDAVLTVTGLAMGTADYVAPEVLLHGKVFDGRADLYSVGVMLTCDVPRGLYEMPGAQSGGTMDSRFDDIIAKALQTKPEARYQTAA